MAREHWFAKYLVAPWLPVQSHGPWHIQRFEVDKMGSAVGLFSYGARTPPPGEYTRLVREGTHGPMMSDTPAEIMDHLELFRLARGSVLMAGLGLGMAAAALLCKEEVERIHVIEIDPDIIAMVGPALTKRFGEDRLTIEQADVLERLPQPGERYDFCWFDIWPDICTDNLPDMGKLHRRWTRRCGGNYLSWQHKELQRRQRQERAEDAMWRTLAERRFQ